jgi:ribosomal protein L11 methyltransferase
LFFSREARGVVEAFLKSHPSWGLGAEIVLPYEDWEAGCPLRPYQIGSLWIAPPWEPARPLAPLSQVLFLDPGISFGSGFHASTRTALLLLEALLRRVRIRRALDLGTGSGILALAAAAWGAEGVLAVDVQPVAVSTARANVRRNRLEDRILVRLGDARQCLGEPAHLLLANLPYEILSDLCARPEILGYPWMILSGMVGRQADCIEESLQGQDLRVEGRQAEGGWIAMLVRNPHIPSP